MSLAQTANATRFSAVTFEPEQIRFSNNSTSRNSEGINSLKVYMKRSSTLTKTCLYNSDPLEPHFYIVKLGFTVVYIIFLISG